MSQIVFKKMFQFLKDRDGLKWRRTSAIPSTTSILLSSGAHRQPHQPLPLRAAVGRVRNGSVDLHTHHGPWRPPSVFTRQSPSGINDIKLFLLYQTLRLFSAEFCGIIFVRRQ